MRYNKWSAPFPSPAPPGTPNWGIMERQGSFNSSQHCPSSRLNSQYLVCSSSQHIRRMASGRRLLDDGCASSALQAPHDRAWILERTVAFYKTYEPAPARLPNRATHFSSSCPGLVSFSNQDWNYIFQRICYNNLHKNCIFFSKGPRSLSNLLMFILQKFFFITR